MKRLFLLAVILILTLAGLVAGGGALSGGDLDTSGMPVPGLEGVQENIFDDGGANLGMPVPGYDVPEMIVEGEEGVASSGMPGPGFDIPEMVVESEESMGGSEITVPGPEIVGGGIVEEG
jgi:hypothetical protein